jgi:hypothetical protein
MASKSPMEGFGAGEDGALFVLSIP